MNESEAHAIIAAASPEVRGEDHAPHPATCLRRLLDAAVLLHQHGTNGPDRDELAMRLGVECGHLAALQDQGLMEAVWDLFGFVRWTPEQAARLDRAERRWRERRG